jgi:hypothetical protein
MFSFQLANLFSLKLLLGRSYFDDVEAGPRPGDDEVMLLIGGFTFLRILVARHRGS